MADFGTLCTVFPRRDVLMRPLREAMTHEPIVESMRKNDHPSAATRAATSRRIAMNETSTAIGTASALNPEAAKQLCIESMHMMATGDLADFQRVVHPRAVNREAKDEPPASHEPGPDGFYATALWLRAAFADLRFDVHHVLAEGDLVVVHNTMSGRHQGPFVEYVDGEVSTVFPPTGATFASTQTHWFRIADCMVVEHWANRDDIGTAKQLGWVPPSPGYLFRMARARRHARRHHAAS
jgi:predicted ester cyclase